MKKELPPLTSHFLSWPWLEDISLFNTVDAGRLRNGISSIFIFTEETIVRVSLFDY